jgi:ABC-type sulfate transport system permease subunit
VQRAGDGRVRRGVGGLRPHPRPDQHLPLHVEILYNEYQFAAAFAVASLLALLALVTLVIKTLGGARRAAYRDSQDTAS